MLQTYSVGWVAAILQARFNDQHFEVSSKKLFESSALIYTLDKQNFRYSEQRIGKNIYPVNKNIVSLKRFMDQYY